MGSSSDWRGGNTFSCNTLVDWQVLAGSDGHTTLDLRDNRWDHTELLTEMDVVAPPGLLLLDGATTSTGACP